MLYTHAKDYLIELAKNPSTHGWMKDLIITVINSNGQLIDSDLTTLTKQLKANGASSLCMPSAPMLNPNVEIRFVELEHKSGICALAPNQSIKFSEQITLLYGKNGSGKSSYFRILNEIVGGNRMTAIEPNIYAKTRSPIDINLKYTENGAEKYIHWDGTERSINPLNLSSVFDTDYTNAFLDRRSADTTIIFPYGLHLFTAITSAMDNIKSKISIEIDGIIQSLPNINQDGLSEDVKSVLAQQDYKNPQKTYIENCYNMSEEQKKKLSDIEERLKKLKETNYDDKINIANIELAQFKSLLSYLKETQKCLTDIYNKLVDLYRQLKIARAASEATKAKIEILKEIENTDSIEWKAFIKAGNTYVNKGELSAEVCPYCRQPLQSNASRIVAAYRAFLEDQTELNLTTLLKQKEQLEKEAHQINTSYEISEQLSKILDAANTSSPNIKTKVLAAKEAINSIKLRLIDFAENENVEDIGSSDTIVYAIKAVEQAYIIWSGLITKLKEEKGQKDSQVHGLTDSLKPLLEYKLISEQRVLFEEWFVKIQKVKELNTCAKELSTRSISTLAKAASQTLITDNLKSKFQEELDALKLDYLQVELSNDGTSRGQSYMKIHLVNNTDVRRILSEGEQKGVALALFIAERRMQLSSNPIILDDPVNSLDHYITANLMERLTLLGNQIVIFSHNILLQTSLMSLNCLHLCGINQRNSCKKTNQHLFAYKISSLGQNKKGIVTEWKQDNVAYNLQRAERKLGEVPSPEIDTVSACLRHAIEMMIDEKVFKNLSPLKYNGKKTNIPWESLKTLHADAAMIDSLKGMYSRLSGGELHSGVEYEENPLSFEELERICNKLKTMQRDTK